MPTTAQNVRLGAFMLAAAAVLVFVLVEVGRIALWDDTCSYFVVSDTSVSGLDEGSTVTMRGVPVGTVDAIELDASDLARVVVWLELDDELAVPANAHAELQLDGLTGMKQLEIADGDLDAGALAPGSEIPLQKSTLEALQDDAMRLAREATGLIADARGFTARLVELGEAIDPDEVERELKHIVAIGDSIDPQQVHRAAQRIEHILANLEDASAELESTVADGRADVSATLEKVGGAADELDELLARVNRILRTNDGDVRKTIRDLRSTARELKELSRILRADPSKLLRSRPAAPRTPP